MAILSESPLLYYIIVNGVIAILVFFTLALFNGFLRQHLQYPSLSNESCTSPNCIRCRAACLEKNSLLSKLEEFVSVTNSRPESVERLYDSILSDARNSDCVRQRPTTLGLLGLTSSPFHADVYKSELQEILTKDNLSAIIKEVSVISGDMSRGWVRNTSPSGSWYVFHLYNQGEKLEWNCEQCPRTVELIENVAAFMKGCAFGNAVFSVVLPGTHITPHYGPTNCRIRCHIPLQIPEGCVICVDQEEATWKKGQPLLFDDSYLHEVWHQGQTGSRIVLMLDLWHPEVTIVERHAIAYLFSKLNWNILTHM